MAKMDKKWVALCSAALAAVYTAGYYTTETEASEQQPSLPAHVIVQSESHAKSTTKSPSHNTRTHPTRTNSLYKDGTYTGKGTNRRGSIQVTVTTKNDKITDVEISRFAMHYSESDVVDLPGEVLNKQSAEVRNVSGATYSTRAFKDAVRDALAQAQIS
ncbi:FMN-binding domain protein [compost metagenome]